MTAWRIAVVALLVAVLGCGRSMPVPDKSPAVVAKAAKTKAEPEQAPPPEADPPDADKKATADTAEPVPAETVSPEPAPVVEGPPPERFVIFAPGGPLVIELRLSIDGKPYAQAMDHLADEVLETADTDGDGSATWDELTSSPHFIYGVYGNAEIEGGRQRRQFIQRYDTNVDGLVDRDEVPRLVTRNRAGGRAFSLRRSKSARDMSRLESPVRRWLDTDGDSVLSADEMAAAPTRLRSRDENDDDIVQLADFTDPSPLGQRETRVARRADPDAAMMLQPRPAWNSILYAMEAVYAHGGDLNAASFPLLPGLFEKLDADGSEYLTEDEMAALNDLQPHIQLEVRFGQPAAESDKSPSLALTSLSAELEHAAEVSTRPSGAIAIALPHGEIHITVDDAPYGIDNDAAAKTRLAQLDGDQNGYLDKEELPEGTPGIPVPFDVLDEDDDGKIYLADIAGLLSRQRVAGLSQILAQVSDQEDPLLAALDVDNDGRLGARELAGAASRLVSLDTSGNGWLEFDEIPSSIALRVWRSEPANNVPFSPPPAAPVAIASDVPPWFNRMDFNGDGDVSPREFLGTAEKFQRMDIDSDGFLDANEARAAAQPADKDKRDQG